MSNIHIEHIQKQSIKHLLIYYIFLKKVIIKTKEEHYKIMIRINIFQSNYFLIYFSSIYGEWFVRSNML